MVFLSVVIPCFNEALAIGKLHDALTRTLARRYRYELVFVDDGSTDGTLEQLRRLHRKDPHVRVVALTRNFGHNPAITAGIEAARGDATIVIDADLQDPPELIPQLVKAWQEGNDVVYARRTSRSGDGTFKRMTAGAFYRAFNALSPVKVIPNTAFFFLISRRATELLKQLPEKDRYLRGMLSWIGLPQSSVPFERQRRSAGRSHYNLARMLRLAYNAFVSFSTKPLLAIPLLGAAVTVLGALATALACFIDPSRGWLLAAVLVVGGLQLTALGVIGLYVGDICRQTRGRPLYLVAERLDHPAKKK